MIFWKYMSLLFCESTSEKSQRMLEMKKRSEKIISKALTTSAKDKYNESRYNSINIFQKKYDEYNLFIFDVKYFRANSLLYEFEAISSNNVNKTFLYRCLFDFDSKCPKYSPDNSKFLTAFLTHSLKYKHINDELKKILEYREDEIEKNILFFDKFADTGINKPVKLNFDWYGTNYISNDAGIRDNINTYEKTVNMQQMNNILSKDLYNDEFTHQRTPYIFSICEGSLPNNILDGIGETFEKYLDAEDLYQKHHKGLEALQGIHRKEKDFNLLKIFYHFFDIDLDYKNINSENLLHLDFESLDKLIKNIKIHIKNEMENSSEIGQDDIRNNENPMTSTSPNLVKTKYIEKNKNLDYVLELQPITRKEWEFFRNYYFSNTLTSYICLFLTNETIKDIRGFFEIPEIHHQIFNDEFFYFNLKKHKLDDFFCYESELCDSVDFKLLLSVAVSDQNLDEINRLSENNIETTPGNAGFFKNNSLRFLSDDEERTRHQEDSIDENPQNNNKKRYGWFENHYLDCAVINGPKIVLNIEVCELNLDKEYRIKIIYENQDKVVYALELGFLKNPKIRPYFSFLIRVFQSEFFFYKDLSKSQDFERSFVVNLPFNAGSFGIDEYYKDRFKYLCHLNQMPALVSIDLNQIIEKLARDVSTKEIFRQVLEKNNVFETKKMDEPDSPKPFMKSELFSLDPVRKYRSNDDQYKYRKYTYSGFVFLYQVDENDDAICYLRLYVSENHHFGDIIENIRECLHEHIKEFIHSSLISTQNYSSLQKELIYSFNRFFSDETLFRNESKKLISFISKRNSNFRFKIMFIITNIIDMLVVIHYNKANLNSLDDYHFVEDLKKDLIDISYYKILIDYAKFSSFNKIQITLYVLDEDIRIRKKIFEQLSNLDIKIL